MRLKYVIRLVIVCGIVLLICGSLAQEATPEATTASDPEPFVVRARFAHFAFDAPAIRLLLNGQTLVELLNPTFEQELVPLSFGLVSEYSELVVSGETYTVNLGFIEDGTEPDEPLAELREFTALAGHTYTIALVGSYEAGTLDILTIDETEIAAQFDLSNKGLYILINTLTGVESLDLTSQAAILVNNVAYGGYGYGTASTAPGTLRVSTGRGTGSIAEPVQDLLEIPSMGVAPGVLSIYAIAGSFPGEAFIDYGSVEVRTFVLSPTVSEGGTIALEEDARGSLESGQRIRYTLTLEATTIVTIELRGVDTPPLPLDAYLRLYDSQGDVIAANDEISFTDTTTDARLRRLMLEPGTYIIEVASWNDAYPGEYRLIVEQDEG
ncbi:MAG: pre-peptidase C-terminal domain-containing protein [bacterium]|nr:pre-peptidase C-terminal domain-containing protein [bacterium]